METAPSSSSSSPAGRRSDSVPSSTRARRLRSRARCDARRRLRCAPPAAAAVAAPAGRARDAARTARVYDVSVLALPEKEESHGTDADHEFQLRDKGSNAICTIRLKHVHDEL